MNVILREDIPSLGQAGDVVKVKQGFARNFLLPQKKALPADNGNLRELEHHKKGLEKKREKLKQEAAALGEKIGMLFVSVAREVGEEGKLFGSVTTKCIAEALKEKGFDIDKRMIGLTAPIRELGNFEVPVRLHSEVTVNLKVEVVKG